jgi:hypothetical protein
MDECACVILPLLGCLKNEHGEKFHLTPLIAQANSGYVTTPANCHPGIGATGFTKGPAFYKNMGKWLISKTDFVSASNDTKPATIFIPLGINFMMNTVSATSYIGA